MVGHQARIAARRRSSKPAVRSRRLRGPEARNGDRGLALSALPLSAEPGRSEEHTSELQSLMRISYAVFCLKKKTIFSYIKLLEHLLLTIIITIVTVQLFLLSILFHILLSILHRFLELI